MAYNGKILAKAYASLADIRQNNLEEHNRRLDEVYAKVPKMKELDNMLRQQMSQLAYLIFSQSGSDTLTQLKNENLSLQQKRYELLVENGFSRDYLDDIYSCPICRDTGVTNSGKCTCLLNLYNEQLTKSLSTLLKNGNESFDNFDLNLYDEQCRGHMEHVLNLAKEYAEYFPDVENLLLTGNPGLGKTYLSACIARSVSSKGYSVYYDSAISIFQDFDSAQFKGDEEAASRCRSCLECDLLILDDMGTEFLLPSVVTTLYNIINTRVNSSKGIIMNSNYSKDEIIERYSAAIGSRINGYFTVLDFIGDDIRKKLLK